MALIELDSTITTSGPPLGSYKEQIAVLRMTKDVISRLEEINFVNKASEPVLWHTDLHMGNIFVAEDDPAVIVSLIDWQ